jgi:ribosomal protein L28
VADFDEYCRHLPEQWCPMVTVIGSVRSGDDGGPEHSGPRRFTVETSVYDASKSAPVQFSVTCFLENTKRWQNVNIQTRRVWVPEFKRFVSLNLTTRDIRTIDKIGVVAYAKRYNVKL